MSPDYAEKMMRLHALIDSGHEWPGEYLFKFIVPRDKIEELEGHFKEVSYQTRPSANGRYISLTYRGYFHSSHQVMEVYERVMTIEGIMSF